MTFSDKSPYYVDGDSGGIKRMMEDSYRRDITQHQQFWNEADIDTRFRAGDQSLWQMLYGQSTPLWTRRTFQFNRIRRIINMPVGYQRKNRKSTIIVPMENSNQQTADQMTKVVQWANHSANVYHSLSDAFEGALVSGMNLLSVWMDYREDPINGDIRTDVTGYNGFLIDSSFKKKDFSDANYIWTRKWMHKKQIISLMPDRKDEIMSMPTTANRDDKFIFLPENFRFGVQDLLPYDEYYYIDYREAKVLIDMETGDTKEWEGDEKRLKDFLRRFPMVEVSTIQKQTCKLAVSVGNRVMYNGPNLFNIDRYPFVGVYGYFEPEIPYYALKMQGMVRGLRDAQFLYNRRKVIELDMLESQINSGIKYKESALIDPNDAFLTGQGRALALRDSANMDDVQTLPPPEIPQSTIELSRMLGDEIGQISGVNEELLGSADDDKAGILSMLRQGAGLTTLQTLFDQLDDSQKQLGSLYIELIQANFTPGKIRRILGEDPTEEFETKAFMKYDAQVEEGSFSINQRQMQFEQLLQLKEVGINVPESALIDACVIQKKQDLIDAIQDEKEQAQQQQQAQAEQAMEYQAALTDSISSKAESDRALAKERLNKIGLDAALSAERIERAHEEQENASLIKVKVAKEIEGMDLDNLHRTLEFLHLIQEQDRLEQAHTREMSQPLQQPQMTQ